MEQLAGGMAAVFSGPFLMIVIGSVTFVGGFFLGKFMGGYR
jgi:hypothetical protein